MVDGGATVRVTLLDENSRLDEKLRVNHFTNHFLQQYLVRVITAIKEKKAVIIPLHNLLLISVSIYI